MPFNYVLHPYDPYVFTALLCWIGVTALTSVRKNWSSNQSPKQIIEEMNLIDDRVGRKFLGRVFLVFLFVLSPILVACAFFRSGHFQMPEPHHIKLCIIVYYVQVMQPIGHLDAEGLLPDVGSACGIPSMLLSSVV